jgi:hypothetical protein
MRSNLQSAFLVILTLILFSGSALLSSNVLGLNITNATVITRVNITNTEPSLYYVAAINAPIDLTAGTTTNVLCNGSFTDYNGYDDVTNVTGTLFRDSVLSTSPDDNNTHYTNSSCQSSCQAVPGTGNVNGSCTCTFPVQYYAQNGSWRCNMTISDSFLLNSSRESSLFTINEVIGISVESPVLDFGNLSATQTSPPTRENVINTGNIPLNVTVRGFGGDDETIGNNVSMICEAGSNLTFGYMRYSQYNDTPYMDMINVTNQTTHFVNLSIPKRVDNAALGNSTNSTWWRLQIPLGPAGVCNGTVVFGARRFDY